MSNSAVCRVHLEGVSLAYSLVCLLGGGEGQLNAHLFDNNDEDDGGVDDEDDDVVLSMYQHCNFVGVCAVFCFAVLHKFKGGGVCIRH